MSAALARVEELGITDETPSEFWGLEVTEHEESIARRMNPLAIGGLKKEEFNSFVEKFLETRIIVQDYAIYVYGENLKNIYAAWGEEKTLKNKARAELFLNVVRERRREFDVMEETWILLAGNPLTILRQHQNVLPWEEIVFSIEKVLFRISEPEERTGIISAFRRSLLLPQYLFPEFQTEFTYLYDGSLERMEGVNLKEIFHVFSEYSIYLSNKNIERIHDERSRSEWKWNSLQGRLFQDIAISEQCQKLNAAVDGFLRQNKFNTEDAEPGEQVFTDVSKYSIVKTKLLIDLLLTFFGYVPKFPPEKSESTLQGFLNIPVEIQDAFANAVREMASEIGSENALKIVRDEISYLLFERARQAQEDERERQIEEEWKTVLNSFKSPELISAEYLGRNIGEILDRVIKEEVGFIVTRKEQKIGIISKCKEVGRGAESSISSQELARNRTILDERRRLLITRRKKIQAVFNPAPKNKTP